MKGIPQFLASRTDLGSRVYGLGSAKLYRASALAQRRLENPKPEAEAYTGLLLRNSN